MREYRRTVNWHCRAKFDDYRTLGDCVETKDGPLIHIDNGGKILAVAHLDAVGFTKTKWSGDIVQCMQLDDRLGVWVLLDLLPRLGCVPFDVLLTDSEELGRSTAAYADMLKVGQYNWMFEFDRAGDDCVAYEYEDTDTAALIEQYGWKVGTGSFTDICSLEDAGIKGFNFGTGYHGQHTKSCYANLNETFRCAKKFVTMAAEIGGTRLEHDANSQYDYYDRDGFCDSKRYDDICTECGEFIDSEWLYCPMCGVDLHMAAVETAN